MRRVAGAVVLLLGLTLGGWVVYKLVLQRLPETEGLSSLPAIIVGAALTFVGVQWVRGKGTG